MKTKTIYWIVTGITAALLSFGAVFNALSDPQSVELIVTKLGYPPYVVPLVGVMKIIGCLVILIPGFKRLKEWAYCGLFLDLGGAVYSHIAIGAPVSAWAPIFVFVALLAGSYFLYHKVQNSTASNTK